MNRKKLKRTLVEISKDILLAFAVVCLVMLALYAYCGIWPPMVVVESGSMQRFDDKSLVGVIDTGDMVFVKEMSEHDELVTYVDGEASDYSKYGTYGDVIIYRPNGLSARESGETVVPIIHRAVIWLELNESAASDEHDGIDYDNYTFDVPSLGMYGTRETIVLENYGYWDDRITIDLMGLMTYYKNNGKTPHGGYITMGDNNAPFYDQPNSGSYEPVLPEWIVGKAIGEIPWFGLIKLKVTGTPLSGVPQNSWVGLYITIFLLLFVPFLVDLLGPRIKKWRGRGAGKDAGENVDSDGALPDAGEPETGGSGDTKETGPEPEAGMREGRVPEKTEHGQDAAVPGRQVPEKTEQNLAGTEPPAEKPEDPDSGK